MPSKPPPEPPRFVCPRCGAVSYSPNDVIYGYCGACHDFTRLQTTQIVDYLDILPFGRRRTWPETKETMEQLREIVRQSGSNVVLWQGHNLYRAVHGAEAPANWKFTREEIDELCRRYIEKYRGKP